MLYMTDKHPPRPLPPYDTEPAITHCRPAANGQGPIRELGRFYQMLLNGGELDGVRVITSETVRSIHFAAARRDCMMKPSSTRSTGDLAF